MNAREPEEPIEARIDAFRSEIASDLARAQCFEETASVFARGFYSAFSDFTILTRVFAVVPFARLNAVERARIGPLDESMPVLTLFGTRGVEEPWNDRLQSRDHRTIPLVSEAFIEEAPMIAKLLAELGASAISIRSGGDWQFVNKTTETDGVFFVGDARTTTDLRGRPVIPASDFVNRYGIRSVFGFGGFADDGTLVVAIVFARKTLLRTFATKFVPLVALLRDGPAGVRSKALFSS